MCELIKIVKDGGNMVKGGRMVVAPHLQQMVSVPKRSNKLLSG